MNRNDVGRVFRKVCIRIGTKTLNELYSAGVMVIEGKHLHVVEETFEVVGSLAAQVVDLAWKNEIMY